MSSENTMITRLTTGFPTPPYSKFAKAKDFKWVKYVALHHLGSQVLQALELANLSYQTDSPPPLPSGDAFRVLQNHTLFSWDVKDFVARRSESTMWMIALEKGMTPECLEHQKHVRDYEELRKHVKIVMQWYLQCIGATAFNLKNYLSKSLAFTTIHEKLEGDYEKNRRNYDKIVQTGHAYKFLVKVSAAVNVVRDDQVTEDEIWDMLEDRYRTRHNEACIEGEEVLCDNILDGLTKQIERYKERTDRERFASTCATDIQNNEIQGLKEYMQWLSADYDRRMEDLEGKGNYTKVFIEKLSDVRQYYQEMMTSFHEDMERVRMREKRRLQRVAEEKEREEAAALEKLKAKKKKKGNKAKNSPKQKKKLKR